MTENTRLAPPTHRINGLRREIAVALAVKAVLLWGIWLLAFRGHGAGPRPDAADLFASAPSAPGHNQPKEASHDVR
ncbi:hypothetical protein [Methylogaea oryzae]|uniref:Uncharacterized protein n=1 Tax=Methylogaea oryzae TaxID=1295382 RepID=A0A8D4VNP5_9GAMM|nr:hypothetical protein [Methylogaea oryzae]BBL71255.1 hypothetical protein MoryE10_18610 [Methylogaea oryzae]